MLYSRVKGLLGGTTVLGDAGDDELEAAGSLRIHVVQLVGGIETTVIKSTNDNNSVANLSLEGISDVGLDELDPAANSVAGKQSKGDVVNGLALAHSLVVGTDRRAGIRAGNSTNKQTKILLVDGVNVVASQQLGRTQKHVSRAHGHGDGEEGEDDGGKVHG